MRSIRLLAAGASALALLISACSTGGAPSPTPAAAQPTTAPKPSAPASASPSTSASPAVAASPSAAASPAASPKPAASPAVSASPSAAASPAAAAGGPKPLVKVASFNFDESEILQELYAQVLEANGYTIERHTRLGTREIVEPALESGQIRSEER